MITSNLQEERERILKSELLAIHHPSHLQIGKKFIVLNANDKYGNSKNPFDQNKDFKVIQILSVTPKLDLSKIDNTITFDRITGYGIYFGKDEIKDYNFRKYVKESGYFYTVWNDCIEYGWLYFNVKYQDIYSKEIKTDIVCFDHNDICFEETKVKPWSHMADVEDDNSDRIYISDVFEYDVEKIKSENSKNPDRIIFLEDDSINKAINELLETELYDYLINNFKSFLAQNILANQEIIDDKDTIEIDGLTWYNGFHNDFYGVKARDYLFYDYIPNGWRLPTIEELKNMLDKHPLLRKKLPDNIENEIARRNNAGMECHCIDYFEDKELNVVTLDDNDYSDEKCYFPCEIRTINLCTNEIVKMTPSHDTWNTDYRPYLILLVKMTDEENKKRNDWARSVLTETFKYNTIDSIYQQYGVDNIDDITGITFDMNIDNQVKTFEKKKTNKYLDKLKDIVSKYIGNNDIYKANKINITFSGDDNISGVLDYNSDLQCDMRSFLTEISPLLCRNLCFKNINTIKHLITIDNDYDDHIGKIYNRYDQMRVPIDMYFYIKNALSQIGINHDMLFEHHDRSWRIYYAGDAYITKLILHMANGKDIKIESLPVECFNQSILYVNEINDKSKYSDNMQAYINEVMTALNNRKDD